MSFVFNLMALLLLVVPAIGFLVLWIASLFSQPVANIVYKLHLLRLGIFHMLFSSDKRWKKNPDPGKAKVQGNNRVKKVILIRHGESAWNVVFNRGFNTKFPGRLGSALRKEVDLLSTLDSVFFDSPLSELGAKQALELREYITTTEDDAGKILRGESKEKSTIVSSNLRRALSTITIAAFDRLKATQEKIHVLSALQEVTFNVDGVALAKPKTPPELSDVELAALSMTKNTFDPNRYYDCSENRGDKPVRSHGIDRLREFAAWCLNRDENVIIAAGHSLFFRFIFQTFLPRASDFIGKKEKMANGAVVSFNLREAKNPDGSLNYAIDEGSIEIHHVGFESKKSKKP